MDIMSTLNVTCHVADVVHKFATYNWTKKSVLQLAVVGGVFIGAACLVKLIDKKVIEGNSNE